MNPTNVRSGNKEPTLEEIAEWCVKTCLMFGTEVSTAYNVAAIFVEGIQAHRERYNVQGDRATFSNALEK